MTTQARNTTPLSNDEIIAAFEEIPMLKEMIDIIRHRKYELPNEPITNDETVIGKMNTVEMFLYGICGHCAKESTDIHQFLKSNLDQKEILFLMSKLNILKNVCETIDTILWFSIRTRYREEYHYYGQVGIRQNGIIVGLLMNQHLKRFFE